MKSFEKSSNYEERIMLQFFILLVLVLSVNAYQLPRNVGKRKWDLAALNQADSSQGSEDNEASGSTVPRESTSLPLAKRDDDTSLKAGLGFISEAERLPGALPPM